MHRHDVNNFQGGKRKAICFVWSLDTIQSTKTRFIPVLLPVNVPDDTTWEIAFYGQIIAAMWMIRVYKSTAFLPVPVARVTTLWQLIDWIYNKSYISNQTLFCVLEHLICFISTFHINGAVPRSDSITLLLYTP